MKPGAFEYARAASLDQAVRLLGDHDGAMPVAGGQFLQWRFLRRGLWWQAHPYSLSAVPSSGYFTQLYFGNPATYGVDLHLNL